MFILIMAVTLIVYLLLVFYVGRTIWKWLPPLHSRTLKILYIFVLLIVSTSFIFSRLLNNNVLLNVIGSYWMALFYLLVLILPVVHLTLLLLRFTRLPRLKVERWLSAIVLAAVITLIGYGSFNAYSPVVRSYDIQIDKQAGALDKLHIVMVSDTHFGILSGKAHAERLVQEINKLHPDLILISGDIIDDDLRPYLSKGIDKVLACLESKYGVYASLGNHDKNKGKMEELISAIEQGNMKVLHDDSLTIENSFTLIGRKDKTDTDRSLIPDLVTQLDQSLPLIMMDHQPTDLGPAADSGVDLLLSGHTHRGQIAPAHLITQRLFENDWGYLRKGQMHSIVSSGYGFWGPPIRIGSRSEIVSIQVTFSP